MISLYEPAYAKVNLTLDVLGLRPDGFHDLQSVMQTVSLHDDVQICIGTKAPWEIVCSDPSVPTDGRNLVWKAAVLFFDTQGLDPDGIAITLTKRIPSQAGLGGGSSDAAAVLRALNRFYGAPLSVDELAQLSARIGSDIPFCVHGGTFMCEGRGERLRPVSPMPDCTMVICKPDFSISTPELYRKLDEAPILDRPDNCAMEQALRAADVPAVAKLLKNVFDPVVSDRFPLMDQIRHCFMESGALGCQMSGSGSAFFGIVPDAACAERLCRQLNGLCPQSWIVAPVCEL